MMKGFVSVFKMLGLATLAIGLMVAGCGSPGSDTAGQVSDLVDRGAFTIPVTVNPAAQSVTFGDGANSAVGVFDGHTVEVTNVSCTGAGTPGDQTVCTIRVINRDSDEYMVNTMLMLSFCVDCVSSPNWANADCTGSPCVRACGVDSNGDNGCATPSLVGQQNGYCIVEDGNYLTTQPFTVKGCRSYPTVASDVRPRAHISPVCGSEDVKWNFQTNDGTHFQFYANVTAQWYPMLPHSESTARINANDWYNRNTLMYIAVDLDDNGTDLGAPVTFGGFWNVGAYQHSTTLAGYGGPSHITMPAGKYFALNLAAEYADRIEDQHPGFYTNFSNYEYMSVYAAVVRYNPAVVTPVLVDGPINSNWITSVLAGGQPSCVVCDHQSAATNMRRMFSSVTGLEVHGTTNSNINFADKGFIFSFPFIDTNAFSWNTTAPTANPWRYYSQGGAFLCTRTANVIPIRAGHYGNTRVNPAQMNCGGVTPLHTNELTILEDQGPDPEPDMPIGLYYFKVQPVAGGVSPSGQGTMFWPEAHSGFLGFKWYWTANTRDGGDTATTDDYKGYCMPFNATYDNPVDQGCPPGKISAIPDVDWVFDGQEQSNSKMTQSGFSVPGNGTFLSWSFSMCVE